MAYKDKKIRIPGAFTPYEKKRIKAAVKRLGLRSMSEYVTLATQDMLSRARK